MMHVSASFYFFDDAMDGDVMTFAVPADGAVQLHLRDFKTFWTDTILFKFMHVRDSSSTSEYVTFV